MRCEQFKKWCQQVTPSQTLAGRVHEMPVPSLPDWPIE